MQRMRLLFACVVGYCTLTIPPTFYVAVLYVVVVLHATAAFVVAYLHVNYTPLRARTVQLLCCCTL